MKVLVCGVGEVPPDSMAGFEVEGRAILVANAGDAYYAIDDTCTHQEASLCEGHLHVDDCTVECALHNAVFSLKTGEALEFPAEDPVRTYPVAVENGNIYIELTADK